MYSRDGTGRNGFRRHQLAGVVRRHWRSATGHRRGRRATATTTAITGPSECHRAVFPASDTPMTANTRMGSRRAGLLGEAEHHLAEDVALDLRGAGVDR